MTEFAVTAEQLCRSFASTQVLDSISISIPRGTICSLLGPNGAGKTTLLRLLTGLIEPTVGTCAILEDRGLPRSQAVLRATGCLIDGFEPPPNTRVEHLMSLSREVDPDFDTGRACALLVEKGISSRAIWKTLSKGLKRWTLLIMMLCRKCRLLLLDEPADGLDPETRLQLYQLIRREANERCVTALIATHIINDIEKITDDVCILHQGRAVLYESLEDLREQIVLIETEDFAEVPDGVDILLSDVTDGFRYWLRDTTGTLQKVRLPGEIRRLNLGLEQIYLTITQEARSRLPGNELMMPAHETG